MYKIKRIYQSEYYVFIVFNRDLTEDEKWDISERIDESVYEIDFRSENELQLNYI